MLFRSVEPVKRGTFHLYRRLKRALVELHMGEVLEQYIVWLEAGALELLPSKGRSMLAGECVDVLANDDAEVLEAHPVDPLVNGRDELNERNRRSVEDLDRLGQHDRGDRPPVSDGLVVRARVAFEKRALVDVKVPIGDADREVAERKVRDVDITGSETVALHRREGSIVPDDLSDRIGPRHVSPSPAVAAAKLKASRSLRHMSLPDPRAIGAWSRR